MRYRVAHRRAATQSGLTQVLDAEEAMRELSQAITYFSIVFAAGFALAFIRIPLLVPQYGVRTAELMEIPVMLAVIWLSSRWIQQRNPHLTTSSLLAIGSMAFLLMIGAELGVAAATSDLSPASYVLSKDPVSGAVYLVSLVLFALAPWLWSLKSRV